MYSYMYLLVSMVHFIKKCPIPPLIKFHSGRALLPAFMHSFQNDRPFASNSLPANPCIANPAVPESSQSPPFRPTNLAPPKKLIKLGVQPDFVKQILDC